MRAFSLYNLHTAFGFDSKVEEQLQPGITISKPVGFGCGGVIWLRVGLVFKLGWVGVAWCGLVWGGGGK
jgi:hypothetical protein